MGFPPHWRDWIAMILSSASTKVLVNGLSRSEDLPRAGTAAGQPAFSAILRPCNGSPQCHGLRGGPAAAVVPSLGEPLWPTHVALCGRSSAVPSTHAGGFPLHPRHPRSLHGRIGADHERRQMPHLADTVLGGGNRPRAASVPMLAFAAALSLPGRAPFCGEAAAHGRAETGGCHSQSYPHLEGKAAKRGRQDNAHPRHTICHTCACVHHVLPLGLGDPVD